MVKFYCVVIFLLSVFEFQTVFADNVTTSIIAAVLRDKPHNAIFSPLMITDGLWQLYLGAEGGTADEISKVLQQNGKTKSQAIEEYSNWRLRVKPHTSATLKWADELFVGQGINILSKYRRQAGDIFHSVPQAVNFGNSPVTSRLINDWVTAVTKGKITHFIDGFDSDVAAVFLSATFFKGVWKYQFDGSRTRKDNFFIPNESGTPKQVKVDMMSQLVVCRRNFIEKLGSWSLELPYFDTSFSMVILLPKFSDGIDKLVANLNEMDLNDIAPKTNEVAVYIDLPRFQQNARLEFKDALISLGLAQLFSDANLSAMTDFKESIRVSNFLQRNFIVIDEEGSTAFPVSEIKGPYHKVRVNHPFVYLIKDDDIVYLAGRVITP